MKTATYTFPTETEAAAAIAQLRSDYRQSSFRADHITQAGQCEITRDAATLTINCGNSADRLDIRREIESMDKIAATCAVPTATPRQIAFLRTLIDNDYGTASTAGLVGRNISAMNKSEASAAITRMQSL